MTQYLSESEYAQLKDDVRLGSVSVDIPRLVARQFFLKIRPQEVKQATGKSILVKKALIWLMNILSPVVFVLSLALIIIEYGAWEATFIVPIAGICWTVIYGLTSDQGGWLIGTVPLAVCFVPVVADNMDYLDPMFLFVLSIWLQRTSFLVATSWLLDLVMSSFPAFEMLEQHLSIESD